MSFFRRLLTWLFPIPVLPSLLEEVNKHGPVMLQQVQEAEGLSWLVQARPYQSKDDPFAPRYAWRGQGATLEEALGEMLVSIREHPVMRRIGGGRHAPRLRAGSGKYNEEYDPE